MELGMPKYYYITSCPITACLLGLQFNSLSPGRYGSNGNNAMSNTYNMDTFGNIALRWMPQKHFDDKSNLV